MLSEAAAEHEAMIVTGDVVAPADHVTVDDVTAPMMSDGISMSASSSGVSPPGTAAASSTPAATPIAAATVSVSTLSGSSVTATSIATGAVITSTAAKSGTGSPATTSSSGGLSTKKLSPSPQASAARTSAGVVSKDTPKTRFFLSDSVNNKLSQIKELKSANSELRKRLKDAHIRQMDAYAKAIEGVRQQRLPGDTEFMSDSTLSGGATETGMSTAIAIGAASDETGASSEANQTRLRRAFDMIGQGGPIGGDSSLSSSSSPKSTGTVKSESSSMSTAGATSEDSRVNIECTSVLKGHRSKTYTVTCCPSRENEIITTSRDGKMIIWNVPAFDPFWKPPSAASSTSSKKGSGERDPRCGPPPTDDPLIRKHTLSMQNEFTTFGVYTPSGNFVATGGLDNTCSIYDISPDALSRLDTGGKRRSPFISPTVQLVEHSQYLSSCLFANGDDNDLITGSGDSQIIRWDVSRGLSSSILQGHRKDVMSLASAGSTLLSGGADCSVRLWDLRTNKCEMTFSTVSDVNTVCFFPDGKGQTFAVGCDDGVSSLYDIRVKSPLLEFIPSNSASTTRSRADSSKQPLAMQDRSRSHSFTSPVHRIEFSRSGAIMFACYTSTPYCVLWNTLTGEALDELRHPERVSDMVLSNSGKRIYTACWDKYVRVWDSL